VRAKRKKITRFRRRVRLTGSLRTKRSLGRGRCCGLVSVCWERRKTYTKSVVFACQSEGRDWSSEEGIEVKRAREHNRILSIHQVGAAGRVGKGKKSQNSPHRGKERERSQVWRNLKKTKAPKFNRPDEIGSDTGEYRSPTPVYRTNSSTRGKTIVSTLKVGGGDGGGGRWRPIAHTRGKSAP